jgi:MFS family permease
VSSSAGEEPVDAVSAPARLLLACAAVAVAFAAADTYVVVLALPDMMSGAGLSSDELQRAAPIVSGFLLGYVGALPLAGRIADVRGRLPVLVGSLVVFALGSLITASAYDLSSMVAGRFLQGVGGGGLVPATLALVADLWPVERRGLPLGIVGAVQEIGSVLGPLLGAAVLAVGDWRDIFWLNLAVGLALAAGMAQLRPTAPVSAGLASGPAPPRRGFDVAGALLLAAAAGCLCLVMLSPRSLVTDVTYGEAFLPVAGSSRWLTPVALAGGAFLVLFLLRELTASVPLVAWRSWPATLRHTDPLGALLLALALGGIVLAFASAEPEVAVFAATGPWLLAGSAVAAVGFIWRQRRAAHPLVPAAAVAERPAWGALAVSLLIGASLIAALVDIPTFARITVYPDSQLDAALVLVQFLVALPFGAVLGGWAVSRLSPGVLTAFGMLLAAVGFVLMTGWDTDFLASGWASVPLVLAGLGFGIAIAPVNAALLAATPADVHGIASALVVVARMVGMLVGISALTTVGLRAFYAEARKIPDVTTLCPDSPTDCPAYGDALLQAGITQLHTVFAGAAVVALLAAAASLFLLRAAPDRIPTGVADLLR